MTPVLGQRILFVALWLLSAWSAGAVERCQEAVLTSGVAVHITQREGVQKITDMERKNVNAFFQGVEHYAGAYRESIAQLIEEAGRLQIGAVGFEISYVDMNLALKNPQAAAERLTEESSSFFNEGSISVVKNRLSEYFEQIHRELAVQDTYPLEVLGEILTVGDGAFFRPVRYWELRAWRSPREAYELAILPDYLGYDVGGRATVDYSTYLAVTRETRASHQEALEVAVFVSLRANPFSTRSDAPQAASREATLASYIEKRQAGASHAEALEATGGPFQTDSPVELTWMKIRHGLEDLRHELETSHNFADVDLSQKVPWPLRILLWPQHVHELREKAQSGQIDMEYYLKVRDELLEEGVYGEREVTMHRSSAHQVALRMAETQQREASFIETVAFFRRNGYNLSESSEWVRLVFREKFSKEDVLWFLRLCPRCNEDRLHQILELKAKWNYKASTIEAVFKALGQRWSRAYWGENLLFRAVEKKQIDMDVLIVALDGLNVKWSSYKSTYSQREVQTAIDLAKKVKNGEVTLASYQRARRWLRFHRPALGLARWLTKRQKKKEPQWAHRVELPQRFEEFAAFWASVRFDKFEEASVREELERPWTFGDEIQDLVRQQSNFSVQEILEALNGPEILARIRHFREVVDPPSEPGPAQRSYETLAFLRERQEFVALSVQHLESSQQRLRQLDEKLGVYLQVLAEKGPLADQNKKSELEASRAFAQTMISDGQRALEVTRDVLNQMESTSQLVTEILQREGNVRRDETLESETTALENEELL